MVNISAKILSTAKTKSSKLCSAHVCETVFSLCSKLNPLFSQNSFAICFEAEKTRFDLICFGLGFIRILTSVIFVRSTYSVGETTQYVYNCNTSAHLLENPEQISEYVSYAQYTACITRYVAKVANTIKIQSMITTNANLNKW